MKQIQTSPQLDDSFENLPGPSDEAAFLESSPAFEESLQEESGDLRRRRELAFRAALSRLNQQD